jgi:hypothetical protein
MSEILKDMRLWLIALVLLFGGLFLYQYNQTKEAKSKLVQAERIAEQNLKAMGDSSIQLKLTREQLAYTDSGLAASVKMSDSLIRAGGSKKDKVMEVIVAKPIIVEKDVQVNNNVRQDKTDSSKYSLDFMVADSVKSFKGASSFFLRKTDSGYVIVGDSTKITDFRLNFDFTLIKYDDAVNKVTRYKIVPSYIDSAGRSTVISESKIKFTFRGVELLDKPWSENVNSPLAPKKKLRLTGAWGIGLNPIGIAPVVKDGQLKLGYIPSISFGYFITLQKK